MLKRPASVLPEATDRPTGKRRAASSGAGPVSQAPAVPTRLEGAKAVEEACGEKYRREVIELGLGLAQRDMQLRLRGWGYAVSREAYREWLRKSRLAGSATEGNCAVFELYRQDLRTWWYVDRLSPT